MQIDISNLSLPEHESVMLLKAEVRRLQAAIDEVRLTDEERAAVRWAEHEAQAFWEMGGGSHGLELATTLRGLLARTSE